MTVHKCWSYFQAANLILWQSGSECLENNITTATLFIVIIMRWMLILYLPFWIYCTKICYAFNIQWLSSNSSSCWAWIMKPIPHHKLLRPVKFCYLQNRKYVLHLVIYMMSILLSSLSSSSDSSYLLVLNNRPFST